MKDQRSASENCLKDLAESVTVGLFQAPEPPEDQSSLDCGNDRLDHRGLQQPGRFPSSDRRFPQPVFRAAVGW
jgi:hypothetical protein